MRIFFDVDYTILGMDNSLRPGTREVFERLRSEGHQIYIWSGMGIRSTEMRAAQLEHLIEGCYHKPLRDHQRALAMLGVPVMPEFVVDDMEDVPAVFGGLWIPPYFSPSWGADAEMERVYRVISEVASTGTSSDLRFRPRPLGRPTA